MPHPFPLCHDLVPYLVGTNRFWFWLGAFAQRGACMGCGAGIVERACLLFELECRIDCGAALEKSTDRGLSRLP